VTKNRNRKLVSVMSSEGRTCQSHLMQNLMMAAGAVLNFRKCQYLQIGLSYLHLCQILWEDTSRPYGGHYVTVTKIGTGNHQNKGTIRDIYR